MPIPLNAVLWEQPLDPSDVLDYIFELGGTKPILDAASVPPEGISSYTVSLGPESVALGLTLGVASYIHTKPTPTSIRVWLSVASGFQSNAAFDGAGTLLPVILTFVTDSIPPRNFQRTAIVTVAQQ